MIQRQTKVNLYIEKEVYDTLTDILMREDYDNYSDLFRVLIKLYNKEKGWE